ncbi:MAG: curli assembly protein CsgF [Chitinivibrionales bacterium]|nr:curli assembly protein CsgF [Chitinivibrionales bacterium]
MTSRRKIIGAAAACLTAVFFYSVHTGELIYTPNNPSFGGNSYNAQWMMSEAQAQNEHEVQSEIVFPETNSLEDFKETLNRQILYRFSQKIVATAFGETSGTQNQLKDGVFNIGDYIIEVKTLAKTMDITITDIVTGNKTKIEIPKY